MKAEQILDNSAKKNMVYWDVEDFRNSHPRLYKTIIEAINEALILDGVSDSLPIYATTFNDKGELEHQRFSVEYSGELITELSKKVNEFETFIDSFNENYR